MNRQRFNYCFLLSTCTHWMRFQDV